MSSAPLETRFGALELALAELTREVALTVRALRTVSAETDRRFQELREAEERRSAEADRRSAETHEWLREMQDRTQRSIDEIRASAARTEDSSRATDKRLGELANKFGRLTEDIVAPSIPEVFARITGSDERIESCVRAVRQHRHDRGRTQEFDVLAWDARRLLVVEVRSTLAPGDVKALLRMLQEVREYLPEARRREVLGALASFHVSPALVRAGERKGLVMLGLSSGLVEVLNRPGFTPLTF